MSEENSKHSTPAIFVQVANIGYGTPGIEIFCNKSTHTGCRHDLIWALKHGGRVVERHGKEAT